MGDPLATTGICFTPERWSAGIRGWAMPDLGRGSRLQDVNMEDNISIADAKLKASTSCNIQRVHIT